MSTEQDTRITVRFPPELAIQIRELADEEKRSINSEIVFAMQQYVANKRKESGKDTDRS